jgi:hypothetical protein
MAFAKLSDPMYSHILQTRGGAVWQLVGLITRRSQVQILPPQPSLEFKSYIIPAHLYLLTSDGTQHQQVLYQTTS